MKGGVAEGVTKPKSNHSQARGTGAALHKGFCQGTANDPFRNGIPFWNVCVLAVAFSYMGLRLNKVSLHSPDVGVHIAKPSLRAHTHSKMEFHSGMEQKSYLMKGCVAEGGN